MSLPIALLHGWGMNSSCWNALLDASAERDLVPLDMPGHGKCLAETFPDTLDELAKQMLEKAPAESIWCAWSLGSLVAMRAALLAPEQIRGLVLLAPTPRFVNSHDWSLGMEPGFFDKFAEGVQSNATASLRRFVLLMFEGCLDARQKSREYFQQLEEAGMASSESLMSGLNILAQSDLRAKLGQIQQPVRLLSGSQDQICPDSAAHWLSESFGWPLTQVEDGHAPMLSHTELVLGMATQIEEELCLV